ncbi:MAG: bifunctional riboflavin kinase/FAD synthetase [Pseudomonadota bacterium]
MTQIIRGLQQARPAQRGCVATIGNFDGVHSGHIAVLDALKAHAQRMQLPACVILFEPQPLEYLRPAQAPVRLTRLRDKLALLQQQKIDQILILPFVADLAAQTAEQFIQAVLIKQLRIKHLLVGDDFRFGQGRQGDFTLLQQAGAKYGFGVESLATVESAGIRISSTRIRTALAAGDMATATGCLGRTYALSGRICRGAQRGRTWGFPTLNLRLTERNCPLRGVFLVRVAGPEGECWDGVANVGRRPTVASESALLLETHLLDVVVDLYGEKIEVQFRRRLRAEQKFATFELLKKQIARDVQQARQLLETGNC